MVQGLMSPLRKGEGDGDRIPENVNFQNENERQKFRLKLFLSSIILLTAVLALTGMVVYLNFAPKKEEIDVHIIPYMQSFLNRMTALEDFSESGFSDGFDYVIRELEINKKRRFTITEIYPFWKWWKNQTNLIKSTVRSLIDEGNIEIAGGGWTIPDEAVVHYRSFIDQFTFGLRRLEEITGRTLLPNVSFLMDNRGHSKEIASLLGDMDFRALMLGGVSPNEQCYRRTIHQMEFFWTSNEFSTTSSGKPDLFTSILDERGLKLNEYLFLENPIIDLSEFFSGVVCQSRGYTTKTIYVPIAANFELKKLKNYFEIIESIIRWAKSTTKFKLNIFYSTPSNYLKSIDYGSDHWEGSVGQFIPYVRQNHYWTGYYSCAASFKYVQRLADKFLQIYKQMITLSGSAKDAGPTLNALSESVALSQHHNLATSSLTIPQRFQHLLARRIEEATETVNLVLGKFTVINENENTKFHYESCLKLNISECPVTEKNSEFVVTLYNPSHRSVSRYIRIPVTGSGYLVRTGNGESVTTQIVRIPNRIRTMPGRESSAEMELIFRAAEVPPLGFKSYYVSPTKETIQRPGKKKLGLVVSESTGKVSAITRNGEIYPITQEVKMYRSWFSQLLIFEPNAESHPLTENVTLRLINDGELLTEYEQQFGPFVTQIIRIYQEEDFVEFNWIVGPIPLSLFESRSIVSSFATTIRNGKRFYTDSNGKGLQENINKEPREKENIGQRIAKNYKAINSGIGISDNDYQLFVFNDRLQGGRASQGQVELMMHRQLPSLAALFPVKELKEKQDNMVIGQHWAFIGSRRDPVFASSLENFTYTLGWEPWLFFADASNLTFAKWRDAHRTEFSGVKSELPKNLRILTLEPWRENQLLLRLENIGADHSGKTKLNLQELFSGFDVTNALQVSLTGNELKGISDYHTRNDIFLEMKRNKYGKPMKNNFDVFLYPSQIETFILTIKPLSANP